LLEVIGSITEGTGLNRLRLFLKQLFTPVTILLVPHNRTKPVSIRLPVLAIASSVCLFLLGASVVVAMSVRAVEHQQMKERLSYISSQFTEMKGTMLSLRKAERDFRKLFGVKSKAVILESADPADTGSLDMETLREQIEASMRTVSAIRTYIAEQKDLYLTTPSGWPASGRLSSLYGTRLHPVFDEPRFHTGVDISVPPGSKVSTTANGIVSFAGWAENSGIVVVVEHGRGFSTAYAHNQKALVKVGQRVARGEPVALSGSTGISTGPHVHYEIWKNGRHADPAVYLARR
jgi:murein DD-endopeptidase MepM/ murein hydrolase activator NlpD